MSDWTEPKELVEICLNCEHDEYVGKNGCKAYRDKKKDLLAPKKTAKPAMMIEPTTGNSEGERVVLEYCNAAIAALNSLANIESMNMRLPTDTIQACLRDLKNARLAAYEHLVDWNSVAKAIVEE